MTAVWRREPRLCRAVENFGAPVWRFGTQASEIAHFGNLWWPDPYL